ncbi:MAG: FAD-dependent oxidoreductase [Spongiibacteraceae bacterium]|nr:FAD-dependent oxidoreductase [Spongiibacteraceae bacterium]
MSEPALSEFPVDVAIFGGGIAGLWLLNRLLSQGYNAILFESEALGGQQSVNSQGMIHGGIKYALGGALTGASEAIAAMPDHWRRCLRGDGDVDLRGATVLSEHFYLWSTGGVTSRLTAFLGSRMSRGRVESVPRPERHPLFRHPDFHGNVYRLVDLVLDVPSLIRTLAANCPNRIFAYDAASLVFERDAAGQLSALRLRSGDRALKIAAQRVVLSAGAGNEALLQRLGVSGPAMQRRPLQQVLVKHDYPHPLYAHCTGSNPSPRLTISTHATDDGRWVWYLGGDLATNGVGLAPEALIERARAELNELLPWAELGHTEWATVRLDRAEPRQRGLVKPDKAFAEPAPGCANVITAWPTKLTLAPDMADEVQKQLPPPDPARANTLPLEVISSLPQPPFAQPCWETLF